MKLFKNKPCLYFSTEYFLGLCEKGPRSSFDCNKYRKIRNKLLNEKIVKPSHILEPKPATWDDFRLVHSKKYVEKLKDPMFLAKILFLDYVNPFDTDIIDFFKFVTGGTIQAFLTAYEEKTVCFNLGGGFHHAKRDKGEGFCPVNDVAVGIVKLFKKHGEKRVLIVDLDYHHGNGTAKIFEKNENIFTFSIHRDNWDNVSKKNNMDILLPDGTEDAEYLLQLRLYLPSVFDNFKPEFVVYIAGADVHKDDTFGTFNLSTKGVLERDKFVYNLSKHYGLPMGVVAGGGYGQHSWELYYNFIKWVIKERL